MEKVTIKHNISVFKFELFNTKMKKYWGKYLESWFHGDTNGMMRALDKMNIVLKAFTIRVWRARQELEEKG